MFFWALGVISFYPTFISAFIHLSQSVLFVVGNQLLFNLGTIFINFDYILGIQVILCHARGIFTKML